jgi:hypothetical protein
MSIDNAPITGTTRIDRLMINIENRPRLAIPRAKSTASYNYYRDYDPQTGRYLQPDPIGLDGGPNPYTYVANNPLRWSDPKGLRNENGPPICPQGTNCPEPPYDPSPNGPSPSPQPDRNRSSSTPSDAARYDMCEPFGPAKPMCETCVDWACNYAPPYCCDIDYKGCIGGQFDNPRVQAECNARYAACMVRGGRSQ